MVKSARVVAAVISLFLLSSIAEAAPTGHPRLHVAFRRSGEGDVVLSDGRYAFVGPAQLTQPGVLFNDATHRRRLVPQSGCGVAGSEIIGGVLAFDCWRSQRTAPRVYSIAQRSWRTVPMNPELTAGCAPNGCESFLTEAGSDWLEFQRSLCPGYTHCSFTNLFQNIATGEVQRDPAVQGGDEIADLNTQTLAHRICSPLKVPVSFQTFTGPAPGQLRFEGPFALATGIGSHGEQTYLERCGTHLHQLIESSSASGPFPLVAASPDAIVWQRSPSQLNIEFLPTRRRYLIELPRALRSGISALALTDHHLYVLGQNPMDLNQTLWTAAVPTQPPAGTS